MIIISDLDHNCLQQCKKKYAAIIGVKSQLDFLQDDELGANIGPADAAHQTVFAKVYFGNDMKMVLTQI